MMKEGLSGLRWRLVAPLLATTLLGTTGPGQAEFGLPVALQDVATGRSVNLAAGPTALHLVFFAPWCPPCMDELESLAEMEHRWAERGYRLVLIAVRNRNTRERLLRFSEQREPPGKIYLDVDGEAQRAFAADELPAHFLLDRAGNRVGRWTALDDGLEKAVRELLLSPAGGS